MNNYKDEKGTKKNYNFNINLPFVKATYTGSSKLALAFTVGTGILFLIGYIMNFENVYTYFPGLKPTLGELIDTCPLAWVISVIGIFVPPVGIAAGFAL